ncbi:MAG: serine protease [Anaerolineae bacterium]
MKSRNKFFLLAGVLTLLLGLTWAMTPARALEKEELKRGLRAAVKLIILDPGNDPVGTCSGTVLDNSGYILTNFHCVGQTDIYGSDPQLAHGELYHPQGILGVAITENPRNLPVPSYFAQYLAGNPDQDVAVIKIIADLDGNPVPETLPLVFTPLVDSDLVDIADEVSILGYPGVGGDTVTFTEGKISGFLDDDGDGVTDWFKTDALVNGGNSGGTAVNEAGDMMAIPSAKLFAEGDTIFFLKPVNHAFPIIQRALRAGNSGGDVGGGSEGDTGGHTISSNENLGQFTFGTGFRGNDVTGQASTFPSGTDEVHAAVPYQKMRDGTSWGYIWQYEGQDVLGEDNLRWNFGPSGVLDLFITHSEGLPDGDFNLQVIISGKIAGEGQFVVGSSNPSDKDAPQAPPAQQSEGVLLTGRIVDYDTGRPIEDAVFIVLQPGKTVADFDDAADVESVTQSFGFTNSDGEYLTVAPLPRGQVYSIIAGKKGYQRLALDDALEILPNDPDLVEIEDVALERR